MSCQSKGKIENQRRDKEVGVWKRGFQFSKRLSMCSPGQARC